jgi:four helix bundle protein
MATIQKFEDIKVWQKSRELCKYIFNLISSGKFGKDYALIDQINRSSGSVMDNIAEGFGRGGKREFINFLSYANASALECLSQLYRAFDRNYISSEVHAVVCEILFEITKMLNALICYLNKSNIKG